MSRDKGSEHASFSTIYILFFVILQNSIYTVYICIEYKKRMYIKSIQFYTPLYIQYKIVQYKKKLVNKD